MENNIESPIPSEKEVVQGLDEPKSDRQRSLEMQLKELEEKREILFGKFRKDKNFQVHDTYNDALFEIDNEIGKITADLENL